MPLYKKPNELDALIDDCLEGRLSETDAAKLSALLEQSAEARARYWEAASIHGLLEHTMQGASLRVVTGQALPTNPRINRWLALRPLTAAAAGIMLGIFCTSMVWAYAVPRSQGQTHRVVLLLDEGFEDAKMVPGRGFPAQAGGWSGDLSASISTELGVTPKEGKRMVRLAPPDKRKFSYAWRIVNLDGYPMTGSEVSRQVEVTASFHGVEAGMAMRHQIRIAAFAEAPAEVRAIWNGDSMFDQVLQHVGRTVTMKPGDHGWQTVDATMEVPPGAHSLVISLAASEADDATAKSAHYLDDVHARFIIAEATP